MATSFPAVLDTLPDPIKSPPGTGTLASNNGLSHTDYHVNANDAIEALEVKVGVDESLDDGSLDYRVAALQAQLDSLQHRFCLLLNAWAAMNLPIPPGLEHDAFSTQT